MKNTLCLVLAVALMAMLAVPAAATPFLGDVETKDAPEVVAGHNQEKQPVKALVVDGQRVELGDLEEKELDVTSIREARKTKTHERLLKACKQLKEEELIDLVPGIEEALSRKSTTLTVPELIVHDLFDLSSEEEIAELLEQFEEEDDDKDEKEDKEDDEDAEEFDYEDNFVTILFDTEIPKNQLIFVIQNYEEDKWRIVPDELLVHDGETIVGVTVDRLSPIAFLVPPGMGEGSGSGDFVPSATREDISDYVLLDGEDDRVIAVVEDPEGEDVSKVLVKEIRVASVDQLIRKDPEVSPELRKAYTQIEKAKSLADLVPDLEEYLEEELPGLELKDLTVRDLFDVILTGDDPQYLRKEGNTITLILEADMYPDQALVVLHNYEDDKWEVINADQIVRYPSGNVSVTFENLSPIALAIAPMPAQTEK